LAAAAALATIELMKSDDFFTHIKGMNATFGTEIERLRGVRWVGDIRRWGLMAGVELVADKATKEAFPAADRIAMKVCRAARDRGVFLRPLGDTIIFVPPLMLTDAEVERLIDAAYGAIEDVLGS
jgi:adenosylmethionine-8-amino-7-oxononanoate aminotransferase